MVSTRRVRMIVLGLVLGTAAFWTGFARLVVFSSRLTFDVMRGEHPYAAVARLKPPVKAEPPVSGWL